MSNWKPRVIHRPETDRTVLLISRDEDSGEGNGVYWAVFGQTSYYQAMQDGMPPDDAALDLGGGVGQALIEELWAAGFRPAGSQQFSEQLELQGRHLEDMRQIAFGQLKIGKP